jgi:hypothetical protein
MRRFNDRADLAREDLRAVLSFPAGRRVLLRALWQSNVLGRSYAPADALATAHNEGIRSVGVWLVNEIDSAETGGFARLLLNLNDTEDSDE